MREDLETCTVSWKDSSVKGAEGGVFGMTVDLGILDYRLQIDCSFPTVLGSLD